MNICFQRGVNGCDRLSIWFVLCGSNLFNSSLTEANSEQNRQGQLKKKIYLHYENYVLVFVKGIRSPSATAGTGTHNLSYFEIRSVCYC